MRVWRNGSRAGLRNQCRKAWRFDSSHSYQYIDIWLRISYTEWIMAYMKKANLNIIKEKAEEILRLLSQSHYYKAPGEDRIINNAKDIIKIIDD